MRKPPAALTHAQMAAWHQEQADPRYGRLARRCWLISAALLVLSVVLQVISAVSR